MNTDTQTIPLKTFIIFGIITLLCSCISSLIVILALPQGFTKTIQDDWKKQQSELIKNWNVEYNKKLQILTTENEIFKTKMNAFAKLSGKHENIFRKISSRKRVYNKVKTIAMS